MAGRVVLVTGAGRGLGKAIAEAFHSQGASVGINDRGESAESLAKNLGARSIAVPADVSDPAQVEAMVQTVERHLGPVDTLVNNAGVLFATPLAEISLEEWRATLEVNLTGAFLCLQAVLPAMREEGFGRVVNIASTAGKTVSTLGGAHYTASKHGLLGLTRAAATEVAADGITVNAVCPGLFDTEMARENATPARIAAYAEGFPIPRLGTPEEVAKLVCFLASRNAAYVTGAAIDINGGGLMV